MFDVTDALQSKRLDIGRNLISLPWIANKLLIKFLWARIITSTHSTLSPLFCACGLQLFGVIDLVGSDQWPDEYGQQQTACLRQQQQAQPVTSSYRRYSILTQQSSAVRHCTCGISWFYSADRAACSNKLHVLLLPTDTKQWRVIRGYGEDVARFHYSLTVWLTSFVRLSASHGRYWYFLALALCFVMYNGE